MKKIFITVVIVAACLSACGKKGPLEPRPQSFEASGKHIKYG
jgi:predicted small lipoprotein YifL